MFEWHFRIRTTKEKSSVTAQLKKFDIKNTQSKNRPKNLYDLVKTPSISCIYFYNHLPSLPAY